MFKKIIIFLAIIAPAYGFAQEKFGYVNANEILMDMPEIKDYESRIATKREEVTKNVSAMETEYNNMIQRFQESEDASHSTVMDRQKQIEQFQERYETYIQNSSRELEELQGQLLAPIQQKLQKAIQDVGSENGFTYIFREEALVFRSDNAVDASPLVKAKLGL